MKRMSNILFSLALTLSLFTAQAVHAASEPQAGAGGETVTLYQFKGGSKVLKQLDQQIQADSRFQQQGCAKLAPAKGVRGPSYTCKLNDATTQGLFSAGVQSGVQMQTTSVVCPTGCVYYRCPPPQGPWACCNYSTWQYCN